MKKILALVIVLLVAVLMVLTKPSRKAHKEAMMTAVKEYVAEEVEGKFGKNVLTSIGKGFVTKTVEVALSTKLKEHDYLLLNTTYINLDGKEKLLSVGMFGHVFTFDKDMLRENLEEAMKDKEE
jgi:hypothetical protein